MEGNSNTALAVAEPVTVVAAAPREMYRMATDVAGVCGEIVQKTAKQIQRKKYVCIEGWQAIATAHGCALSVESVDEDAEGNVTSVASVRRMADGCVIAKAEGFVGMDEGTWRGRARYARRAMAQTRAMSRAARSAFAHVVVLIDAGLSTTPAEEVPAEGFDDHAPAPSQTTPARPYLERLDDAFKARGFSPEQADDAITAVLNGWKIGNVEKIPPARQVELMNLIGSGYMDKFKTQGKAAQ